MKQRILLLLFVVSVAAPNAFGLGADHKPGDLPHHKGWPAGVYEAVNSPHRTHGFWINSSDTLFYRGNSGDLHAMLKSLADAREANVRVVLHPGNGIAKSPWSEKPVGPADWSVKIFSGDKPVSSVQNNVTVDVWLGGDVTLNSLEIPASLPVKSGGEIEAFIQKHSEAGN